MAASSAESPRIIRGSRTVFASLPSPGSGSVDLGPLTLRAYGVMIALGVLAAVWLTAKRFGERGSNPDHATGMAMWAVPAGLVGARLYHVITDWQKFEDSPADALKIWEGGLGILGAVVVGALGGVLYVRRHNLGVARSLDIATPALPLAQAIGRWGNWWNQELFGKPTDVPWALEIDAENRPEGFQANETFHPTFLYESLWNVGVLAALLMIERTGRLKPGRLLAAYLALYALGRIWIEWLRIDPANEIAGLRVNLWVYGVVLLVSLAVVVTGLRPAGAPEEIDDGDRGDDDADDDPDEPDDGELADGDGEGDPDDSELADEDHVREGADGARGPASRRRPSSAG